MKLHVRGAEDFVRWALDPRGNPGIAKISARFDALGPYGQGLALRALMNSGPRGQALAGTMRDYYCAAHAARHELVTGVGKKPAHNIAAWIRETAQIIRSQLPLGHTAHMDCAEQIGAVVRYRTAVLRAAVAKKDDVIMAALLRAIGDSGATFHDGASVLAGCYLATEGNSMRCLGDVINGLRRHGFDARPEQKERPFAEVMMAWGAGAHRDPYVPMGRTITDFMKSSVG